jgi:hypothetical protein
MINHITSKCVIFFELFVVFVSKLGDIADFTIFQTFVLSNGPKCKPNKLHQNSCLLTVCYVIDLKILFAWRHYYKKIM